MAKLGPFCRRDNRSLVRGVLERLLTHLSMWLIHVWLVLVLMLDEGSPAAGWVATAWVEGVGAMGVAGMLEVVEDGVDLLENLDGTFGCPLKVSLPCYQNWGYACWYYDGIHNIWNVIFQTFWCVYFWFCCACVLLSYRWIIYFCLNLVHDWKWCPWTFWTGLLFVYLRLLGC